MLKNSAQKVSFGIVKLDKPMEFFIVKRTKQVQKIENVKTSELADICRFINLYICTFILALRNLIYTAADAPEACFNVLYTTWLSSFMNST